MAQSSNIFADLPAQAPEELLQTLLAMPGLRLERIASYGRASPEGFWYDQGTHEWVLLVRGAARLRIEGSEPLEMTAGSFVNIPAHKRHRVEWTDQQAVWLALCYSV